jgi:ABC-2 type transport system ATP-binding protein
MINIENLTKEYDLPGAKRAQPSVVVAADHVNLQIPAGEIFGLVGPNGAGKTTTLKMVCGLLVPTSGRVTVNGIDVEAQPESAQQFIGYLADFFSLYDDLRVWEYLDFFARAYKMNPAEIAGRIDFAISVMGLDVKRDAFISGLSRGMKQRLGIARAILHDPPVLVLDEPASGLDPKARVELKELLITLHRTGKTIFITSHVLADLEEICTSVAILEKGKLVRMGRLDDVLREATGAGGRRIRLRLAAPGFALTDWLAARTGTSGVTSEATGAQFFFAGDDAALAELIRALITAGAPVCGVEESVETLERLFSRLSSGEVM